MRRAICGVFSAIALISTSAGCASIDNERSSLFSLGPVAFNLPSFNEDDRRVAWVASEACPVCSMYEHIHGGVVRIRTPIGQGTGVVVSQAGDVITNAHVVREQDAIMVETFAGTMIRAQVARADDDVDLALLRTYAPDVIWTPLAIEHTDPPRVGAPVYVIGHPVGLGWTVTQGIVSSERKPGEVSTVAMLQTDAAVAPGNSGGPVLDNRGRVVGVVRSKLAGPGLDGVAFAIPVAEVQRFLAVEADAPAPALIPASSNEPPAPQQAAPGQ